MYVRTHNLPLSRRTLHHWATDVFRVTKQYILLITLFWGKNNIPVDWRFEVLRLRQDFPPIYKYNSGMPERKNTEFMQANLQTLTQKDVAEWVVRGTVIHKPIL